jgi:UDP-N-acetylglucosamine diphosphorylase/glucosamine-1-phosphate N-acetyltransferase
MRVCLFEDRHVEALEPLSLTRPAYELLCGLTPLASKQWRPFSPCSAGVLVRPHLADLQCLLRGPQVAVNDLAWLHADSTILVNARWLPPSGLVADLRSPCVALAGGEIAFAILRPEHLADLSPETIDDCLVTWKNTLPHHEAGGSVIHHLWELVDLNGPQIIRDFERSGNQHGTEEGTGVAVVGSRERLVIDPTARVDPMVVADTTGGPIVIDAHAVVTAFTRVEGPCYIGSHTHVLGAKIRSGTTIGPYCRVGGEVEGCIIQGYTNKYHDGFLGHSYVGEWVNLGAGTQNSDLRNDYGEVTVTVAGTRVPTGRHKVGCFIGDHTKSGLGTLLNTGTSAGVFCNLLPTGGYLPKFIPSFCTIWNGALAENPHLSALLETARQAMSRRDCMLTDAHVELYQGLQGRTALERQRALREAEQRRLRRSA